GDDEPGFLRDLADGGIHRLLAGLDVAAEPYPAACSEAGLLVAEQHFIAVARRSPRDQAQAGPGRHSAKPTCPAASSPPQIVPGCGCPARASARRAGARKAASAGMSRPTSAAPAIVVSPPLTALTVVDVRDATAPARKLPSWGTPAPTAYSADKTRPRSLSGVTPWTSAVRSTTAVTSPAPAITRVTNASQNT